MLIAVNAGNYNTKAKSCFEEKIFPSRAQLNIDAKNYITIAGKKYEVGFGTKDIENRKDISLVNYLCTLYAIGKLIRKEERIKLVLALPINQYLNRSYRELYQARFKKKHFCYVVDGEEKEFTVEDCLVYMEGAAVVASKPNKFKDTIRGVVDIGGYTINCCLFDNQKLIQDSFMSLDMGMYTIERKIADTLNRFSSSYIKDYEVKYLFKRYDPVISDVIRDIATEHLIRLKQCLLEKQWNLSLEHEFTGGGAMMLVEHINNVIGSVPIEDNCIWDTVRGLYRVGELVWSNASQ